MAIQTCPKCGAKNRVDENATAVSQPVCNLRMHPPSQYCSMVWYSACGMFCLSSL
jgi:hypothetical protein